MAKSSFIKKVLFLASVTGSLAAVNYFINNENNKNVNIITNKKSDVERLLYEWKYGNISYKKYGCGTPVLLIHELNCGASNMEWDRLYEELGSTNTVYMIDLLGCGLSDKPYITYTNYLFVQLISDFIEEVIGESVDIISSGNGSAISAMTFLNKQENVNKMIFINPDTSLLDNPNVIEHKKIYEYLMGIPVIGTTVFNYYFNKENSRKYTENKFVDPEDREYYENHSYINSHYNSSKSKYLFASMEKNMTDISIKNAVKAGDDRIMIICGESNSKKDDIINCYKFHNQKISTKVIGKSNSYPHIENAQSTLCAIKEFISGTN